MEEIIIRNLTKRYGKEIALNDISLSVRKGEFLVILGNSGSGKTTLLNCIAGLDTPDSGRLLVSGCDLPNAETKELFAFRRKKIGYVFQSFNLMQELTVLENVALFADKEKAQRILEEVGMAEFLEKYPSTLSGGQQQRVSIARALAKPSEIIIADEPTGALDDTTGRTILDLLIQEQKKQGKTLIMVTHTKEIGELADHVVSLRDGKIEEEHYNDKPLMVEDIHW